jgi:uncharacterized SAM-binding protein YcdF (DUF218 family)
LEQIDTHLFRLVLSSPFRPLSLFCILALLGLYFSYRGKRRPARYFTIGAAAWFYLISTAGLPWLVTRQLEQCYPSLLTPPAFVAGDSVYIVVLGAGHKVNAALPAVDQLADAGLCRLSEGIRLHRLLPGSTLVTSGYAGRESESNAMVQKKAAMELGVSEQQIDILPYPGNTMEEAQHFVKKFGVERPVILVTDAVHLPRSMFWFERAGVQAIPAPANHRVKSEEYRVSDFLMPSTDNIRRMEVVVHEWMGLVWGRVK